ncbi:Surfeit locus 1 family protein [Labrys sp. WJW]|uniref:SURF1 family protein n=1 Tax=Labrys sp. WJW TaxID=1737983 RepID=UPI00082B7F2E|nr:Surfeit locus 1 family protein [Labrys sp. WJW]
MTTPGGRPDRPPRSRRGFTVMVAALVVAFAGFCALGVWQVQRLGWKLDLIARIDARIHAEPAPPPGPAAWPAIAADKDAYRRIRLVGEFLDRPPVFVQATTARGGGFWTLSPLKTEQGFVVLVNRGFVLPEERAKAGNAAGPAEVTGLLRLSEPKGAFLRSNDPSADRWYSRDVAEIAAARGLGAVAPYFIDAERKRSGEIPAGGMTVVDLPNNHLVYALTWFALALMTLGGLVYTLRERRAG